MDYLNFEKRMTNELTVMFRRAEDPVTKEMARLQTLRTREWCRDYWVAMNREVPVRIGFSKEGRMNEHIEVVKKWLADNDSVSNEELTDNKAAAYAAAYAAAAAANAAAADAAAADAVVADTAAAAAAETAAATAAAADAAAVDASAAAAAADAAAAVVADTAAAVVAAATHWVKKYGELTNG